VAPINGGSAVVGGAGARWSVGDGSNPVWMVRRHQIGSRTLRRATSPASCGCTSATSTPPRASSYVDRCWGGTP
jgi:hypothetical protein